MSGGAWFRQAVELARRHPRVLLPWGPVLALAALSRFLSRNPQAFIPKLLTDLVLWLGFTPWASATTLFYLAGVRKGEAPSLGAALGRGLSRTPSLSCLFLVMVLLEGIQPLVLAAVTHAFPRGPLGGLILALTLSGIALLLGFVFLLARLALAGAALVLGDTTIFGALTYSWAATRTAFFPVLGLLVRVVLVAGLVALLGLIPGAGPAFKGLSTAVEVYLATAGTGHAYLELRSGAEAGPSPATPPSEEGLPA